MTEFDKRAKPTKLLWMDLEMTGLDPAKDVLLEVAVEITDFNFKSLASFEARIAQSKDVVLDRMQKNPWWNEYPKNRDQFVQKLNEGRPLADVEQTLIALVKAQFGNEPAILAGNSIHNDRNFIKSWWPTFDRTLHYRMLDVTTLKIFMMGKYGVEFEKQDAHRAFDDIQASIAEWQYYMEWLRKHDK